MIQAIIEHGIFKGLWLGTKRISKCHPWGTFGYDPVPKKNQDAMDKYQQIHYKTGPNTTPSKLQ
jgi:putative component of membrane protein insertase Oxa1/YidC/SpoIIIJ protein YidD